MMLITESVWNRMRVLHAHGQGTSCLRVRVDVGGCAGFQYQFAFEAGPSSGDHVIQGDDLTVIIDDVSLEFLKSAELDYVEDMMGGSFLVKNPDTEKSCGCKMSFSPKNMGAIE